ncbi:MAG: ATP-binding protein [Rubrobacter sp.]|nr:ATP-binding protein [Rubrobacter sp.]
MERIGDLLPDSRKVTSGSSGSRDSALRLDDQVCPHCGRGLQAEWVEFPPALQRKFGKMGEWDYHPCTPECEKKNEQREWELMRRDARVENLQDKSGLSKRMRNYTFANFKPFVSPGATKAAEKVEEYLKNWKENREAGNGLYLGGGVGTGKTHLAVAVMNELIQRERVPSLFVTVPELLDNLRGAYNDPGKNLDEWMEAVKNADLLILDDLGSEKATLWVQERLFVIINHRYRETLPTVITSNTAPRDLGGQLGERTASRIFAMCTGVELEGSDYRETAARDSAGGDRGPGKR